MILLVFFIVTRDLDKGLHFHGMSGHSHGHDEEALTAATGRKPFVIQGAVLSAFMCFEFLIGYLGHSVALMADAFHMLIDVGAAGASIFVISLLRRPENDRYTFGLQRADVIMAESQGLGFLIVAAITVAEGVQRFLHPSTPKGAYMITASIVGALASLFLALILGRAEKTMTSRAGIMHEMQDATGFVLTALAGVLVTVTGWGRWDAVASFFVAILMLRHSYEMLKDSGRILLEATPEGIDLEAIRDFIESHETTARVVNLHVWSISDSLISMSVWLTVADGIDCHVLQGELAEYCQTRFGISHTTIQTMHSSSDTATA